MSAEPNYFESLRELVELHRPERLASFDRLAHRMRAHKDDEIFGLIEAASLSALIAGDEVRKSNTDLIERLDKTMAAPTAIIEASKAVSLDLSKLETAATAVAAHAASLRSANLRNVLFLIGFAAIGGGIVGFLTGLLL